MTLALSLTGCYSAPKAPKHGPRLRYDLKEASPTLLAPHGFSRYSGELRTIKRGFNARTVHVPGRFETCARTYQDEAGRRVVIFAVVHQATKPYWLALEQRLKGFAEIWHEDAQGAGEALALDSGTRSESAPGGSWLSQAWLLKRPALQGRCRGVDLTWAAIKAHLEEVGLEPGERRRSERAAGSEKVLSFAQQAHLAALVLVGCELGNDPGEAPPRDLYKASAEQFKERRPYWMGLLDYGLVYRRNDEVMRRLSEAFDGSRGLKELALLYGAAHAYDLESRLMERGFRRRSEEWLVAWQLRRR